MSFIVETPEMRAGFTSDSVCFEVHGAVTVLRFAGSNQNAQIDGEEPMAGTVNVFSATQPRTGMRTFGRIRYRDLYPGIDLNYSGTGRRIKAEFLVSPDADPTAIRLAYDGEVSIAPNGDLVVRKGVAELREEAPAVFQDGRRIDGQYHLIDAHTAGFELGIYDHSRALTIDPTITYGTYMGGSGIGAVNAVAVDSAGDLYIAGWTEAMNFPIAGAYQASNKGSVNAFVAKLSAAGTSLIYATYIGGNSDDRAWGIAVDPSGNAYVTGSTTSNNFPLVSSLRSTLGGGRDAFVLKLNSIGNILTYSTLLGGSGSDWGYSIAVDSSGNAYVAGDTLSSDFPVTSGAAQTTPGGQADAFVAKLTTIGAMVFSTYLGGSAVEHAAGVAIDSSGNVYVAGGTLSTNFPTVTPIQAANAGGQDAFVAKIKSTGTSLVYSTYLGGSGGSAGAPEQANGIAVDGSGNAYVAGVTPSANFPVTSGALQASNSGGSDAFVAKISAAGNALTYSTYLGGSLFDQANAIAVDSSGDAYVAGYTASPDFAVVSATQLSLAGMYDAFVTELGPAGNTLVFSTFFGGTGSDEANSIALDSSANIYVGGQTNSTNLPLTFAYQTANNGGAVGWVARLGVTTVISPTPDLTVAKSHTGNFTQGQTAASYTITASNAGTGPTTGTVTVTESLPTGLTATSMLGSGWSCTQPAGPCTRSDVLAAVSSYAAITLTVNVSSSAPSSVTNTVTVSGGGETNTSNDQASDPTIIQVSVSSGTATSIFSSSAVPQNPFYSSTPVTVGTKFQSDVSGSITGIRFYKGAGNNGTHVGLLFGSSGTLLGQATFTGETASGWQQVNLSTPVAIAASTVYVVAYFSTSGFAYDASYFTTQGVNNPPLHALQYGVDGPNGVYLFGSTAQFPTSDGLSENYWADIVFSASSVAATPDLFINKSHSGSFIQGQTGATYTITASNAGPGPTNGIVTVTESLPSGLTATSMAGSGWGCTQPGGPCTRSDVLAGLSYPAITLTVNVSGTAPASVTNVVTVSGGGETNTSNDQASDPTTIQASVSSGTVTSIFSSSAVPQNPFYSSAPATLGTKFQSDVAGNVTAIRFYKGAGNNGSHVGLLYSASGTLLAQATFTGETASGWQQVNLSAPVAIAASTVYVVAYFTTSGFAYDAGYFGDQGVNNPPLHVPQDGVDGPNGVYLFGSTAQFPTSDGLGENYWADVVFSTVAGAGVPDLVIAKSHTGSFTQGQISATYTITASNSGTGPTSGTVTVTESLPAGLTATSMLGSGWACSQPAGPCTRGDVLAAGSSYPAITLIGNVAGTAPSSITNTVTVSGGGETNTGNDQASDPTTVQAAGSTTTSIFSSSAVPQNPFYSSAPVTLGTKFQSDVNGHITAIRFYKGAGNSGTHTGLLYSSSGTLLAQATFTSETASGWQQMTLSSPVAIVGKTVYVVAYFSTSGFAYDPNYFASQGVNNSPLHALQYGVSGPNGVYLFGSTAQFPTSDGMSENYWMDVVFTTP